MLIVKKFFNKGGKNSVKGNRAAYEWEQVTTGGYFISKKFSWKD
jgi:hypothetical protein